MTAAARGAVLKPLRHPRLWLGLWIAALVATVVASLLPVFLLPVVPPGGDKVEHLGGYALLAAAAVQLFAGRRALWRAALGLVVLGVALEVAQGLFTATRQMDAADALANSLGVAIGMATVLTPLRDLLLRLQRR
ncbi:VanZ family protein [Cognatiluteimonas telluris]|uniref:VanZ family protein n=1 Tax=Cognatiluteimonas telluris TaxID=1104775 RepID=UPI00140A888D|nr:VanZ family protein [Lysobacter telluris]